MIPSFLATFYDVIEKLENNHIPYMVVGSVASTIYGEARMTHDLDLVINIIPSLAKKMSNIFSKDDTFYCPPLEVIQSEVTRRGQFNLIHQNSGLKIDCILCKDTDHAYEEFSRRLKQPLFEGVSVYVASPEDVILKKLVYFRDGGAEKHLRDIRGVLAEQAVDESYLQAWIRKLKLEEQWQSVVA